MAAITYLFLLTLPFASAGSYSIRHENGLTALIPSKFPNQRIYLFPNVMSPEAFIYACRSRNHDTTTLECLQELAKINRRQSLKNQALKTNTRNSIPGVSNEKSKVDKPESYINSILDEDKRDAPNFNASDDVLNSTWIEIKDPIKTDIEIKSEIADAKETNNFVTFSTEIGEKTDASIAEERENKANSTRTDGSVIDGEITTEIQQSTTITETSDVITSGETDEEATKIGETGDITLTEEVIERKETRNQDPIITVKIDDENQTDTSVQEKITGVSSTLITEKSTITDLQTVRANFEFNKTTENATVRETDIEVTTVDETDLDVTTEKGIKEGSSTTEKNLSTEIRSTLTSMVPEDSSKDTTLATGDSTTSTAFITTLPTDPTKSESVSVSDAGISTSSKADSATSISSVVFPSVSVTDHTTESSDGGFTSTMITDSKTSNGHYVTKSIPVVPEHTINIRSIKIAKVVLSVLLLVTGLIAVVMLAVYLFRVRRGAIQYDQLTLLP